MIYIGPGMPLALWVLYIIGIQYKRGGAWRAVAPFTIVAFLMDVFFNYTFFAALTLDYPRRGEYTFSQRLCRLVTYSNWQGSLAKKIAKYMLDPFDPSGQHIHPKAAV